MAALRRDAASLRTSQVPFPLVIIHIYNAVYSKEAMKEGCMRALSSNGHNTRGSRVPAMASTDGHGKAPSSLTSEEHAHQRCRRRGPEKCTHPVESLRATEACTLSHMILLRHWLVLELSLVVPKVLAPSSALSGCLLLCKLCGDCLSLCLGRRNGVELFLGRHTVHKSQPTKCRTTAGLSCSR